MLDFSKLGLISFLLALSLISGCGGAAPAARTEAATTVDQRLIAAETRFGIDLLQRVRAEEPGKNIFLSPASASLALSMTLNGARGETQRAMARALAVEAMTPAEMNQANAALQSILLNPDKQVQVEIANSLWFKQGLTLSRPFARAAREQYRAEVKAVEFGKAGAERPINQWVASATHDRIKSIIDRTKANDRMYLLNAIYFNGTWKVPFRPEATRPLRFTREDGTSKEHPMMTQDGHYRYLQGENFQAVALPYGEGRMSLYVFVPDPGVGPAKFCAGLTVENWESWMGRFQLRQGSVTIPTLKLAYEKRLNEALIAMGMGAAFADTADFGGLFANLDEPLSISYVEQKTYLEMNEKGTEAAAVTVVAVPTGAAAPSPDRFTLVADRPYFIAIRDDRTGALLFVGAIADPQ